MHMNSFKSARPYLFGLFSGVVLTGLFAFGQHFEISKNLEIFSVLMRELDTYYVDEINPGDLTETAVESMLESLDPYTNFIPESEIENHRMSTTGQYGGIGAVVRKKGEYVTIYEPYEETPAAKAGLQAGDKLVKVNDKSVVGMSTDDVVKLLRGAPNTGVRLTIERPGASEPKEVELTRERIQMKNVSYYGMADAGNAYIKLERFTPNAGLEIREALDSLKKAGKVDGLILDLRGNPGGLLREAISVVNNFVPRGEMVVTTKGKVSEWNQSYRTLADPADVNIPLVVLVNRGSASASEIVSGTIQDLDRGVVLGQKTFGKGLVQSTRPLVYNTHLKLTTSKYYIPSGRCIQALDYSHRDANGRVNEVPDSLRTKFKTQMGRVVYDGAGIYPDVPVKPGKTPNILRSLVRNDLFFEFATEYVQQNPSIKHPSYFEVSDALYQEFLDFLATKEYSYTTRTEQQLDALEVTAEKEEYLDRIRPEFEALLAKKEDMKSQDLKHFKKEISKFLRLEIVSRYYYRRGRIASDIKDDEEVLQALEVLNSSGRYDSILSPSFVIPAADMADDEEELSEESPEAGDEE